MHVGEKSEAGLRRLADIFTGHPGNMAYKWQQYVAIYETEFLRFIEEGKPVSLLEIGVMNGGSLEIWKEYLPEGSRIVGLDVNPECARLDLGDRIEVAIGDATDRDAVDRLLGDRTFDIIIDDGSHRSPDVIGAFANVFHRLEPGGIFVIEDCHTSYRKGHEGGYLKADSTIEWAKTFADAVNYDHIERHEIPDDATRSRLEALNREVGRVAFYDSIVVIEKLAAPKEKPFAAFIVGQHAPVHDLGKGRELRRHTMLGPFVLPKVEAGILESLDAERAHSVKQSARIADYEGQVLRLTRRTEAYKAELTRKTEAHQAELMRKTQTHQAELMRTTEAHQADLTRMRNENERLVNLNRRLSIKLGRLEEAREEASQSPIGRLLGLWPRPGGARRRSRRA
jgi:SAM-dependent methyltransferase